MKIGNTGSTPNIQPEVTLRKHRLNETAQKGYDSFRTSEMALSLSRNAAELQNQLQPRDEVLRKFAGIAESNMNLDDVTIDRIIDRMRHA